MMQWIQELFAYWEWFLLLSLLMFFASILMLPVLVSRIPADYFAQKKKVYDSWANWPTALRFIVFVVKQLLGILLVIMGVVMLITPGQGILTIVVGLMLVRFPGKYRLVRWIVRRPSVLRAINWMRARGEQPPLEF